MGIHGFMHEFLPGIRSSGTKGSVAVLLAAGLVAGCKSEAASQSEPIRPVKVAVVKAAAKERTLSYSGVVRPRIESALGFRVPGKIVARFVNVGDHIDVGHPVGSLDDTDLKLTENAARAAVAAARTRRDVARDSLERAKVLLPKEIIAQTTYDARRNELDAATAALDSAESQLRQAVNAVGYATLTADKAGIVTSVTGEPGQVVSAGQPVISLAVAGATEVAVGVPEQDAGRLAIGQTVKIALWAGPRVNLEGRVREIAGQADPASRTYATRIAVDSPPQAMRLGMTATVTLSINEDSAPMFVPLTALTERDGDTVAFVVDAANKVVRKTAVTVAGVADSGVQILGGLRAGDTIVSGGVQFLRDGMRIRLPDEHAQTITR